MLCTAIIIQRKVGGNLADVLEKISETMGANQAKQIEEERKKTVENR